MVKLGLVRHGTTDWNHRKIIQGRTDIPLNEFGRKEVAGWSLPPDFEIIKWLASPLTRATETASIMKGEDTEIDHRLSEMSWGDWEGCVLDDLREKFGNMMLELENKGLDFKSPNGESPREVQFRVMPLLEEISRDGLDTLAICHKGVIRAIYAMADNWDMIDKPQHKLKSGCLHLFELKNDGQPQIVQLNIDMTLS